jgi:ABC-type glutathione transport system ATPase component
MNERMSERESSQRERGATRADRRAVAPDGLSEEREMPIVDIDSLSRHFVVRRSVGRLRREKRVVRAVDGISFTVG